MEKHPLVRSSLKLLKLVGISLVLLFVLLELVCFFFLQTRHFFYAVNNDLIPKLLDKVSGLQAAGVKVFNAVNVFDETGGTVYRDNCCHYNDAAMTSSRTTLVKAS